MGPDPSGEGGKRMIDSIKQTRSSAATPERAEAGAGFAEFSTSTSQSITPPSSRQRISDLLTVGEENAVPLRRIKQLVNLPGREIRRQIQAQREQHTPILSGRHGYFLAGTVQEKERFVRSMRGQAAEIEAVADAVEKAVID